MFLSTLRGAMLFTQILLVFGIGTVEIWAAIPTGLALGLDPYVTCAASILGGIAGIFIIALVGERLRNWILRKWGKKSMSNGKSLLNRIWRRWGLIGLGLSAPLHIGAPASTAVAIAIGTKPRRAILWLSLGLTLWCILITAVAAGAWAGIQALFN